jgi:hypothetical protein
MTPARVAFTPRTNSQRSAVARFGTTWELAPFFIFGFPVRGVPCAFIQPPGLFREGRWVRVEQVTPIEENS